MSDLSLPEPVRREQVLDVQHDTDPEKNHGLARRIPHMGHAALFFSLAAVFELTIVVVMLLAFHVTDPHSQKAVYVAGAATVAGYLATLAVAFPLFPLLWQRSFLDGIHWTFRAVQLHWWKLILLGFGLSGLAQLTEHLVKMPKGSDIIQLFKDPRSAWLTTLFGGLFIPIFEEIAFRGFLLPAFATAYDWLSLPRTPAALQQWQLTTNHTRAALIFSTCITSVLFVGIHGMQLHWSPGALAVLFVPSIAFCIVRIRLQSVAAAALVHMSYDSLIFLEMVFVTHGFRHLEKLGS